MDYVILNVNKNGVATITMNDPDHLNPFTVSMCNELIDTCNKVADDQQIKAVILTGTGNGFCSGGDISVLSQMSTPRNAKETFDLSSQVVKVIYELNKPVIAAVNGIVAGAGLSLMMACDMVVASENARLGFTFRQIAYCPDSGCSFFLTQRVGRQKANELLMLGRIIKAEEAMALGLFNRLVSPNDLMSTVTTWANTLAEGPSYTLLLDKLLTQQAENSDFHKTCEQESLYQVLAWSSDDFKEGGLAFSEKRRPLFTGR